MAATEAKRQANRWPALLDAAAAKFAEQGYHATTIRELALATAMTPGAIYFHVPNKQALLLAVYEEGVQRIVDHVDKAVAGHASAWDRLNAAVEAHLEAILDASAYRARGDPHSSRRRARNLRRSDAPARPLRAAFPRHVRPCATARWTGAGPCPSLRARRAQLDAGLASARAETSIAEIARQLLAPLRAAGERAP